MHRPLPDWCGEPGRLIGGYIWPEDDGFAEVLEHGMFFWQLLRSFPSAVCSWGHNSLDDPYMLKLTLHIDVPGWLQTTALPRMHGRAERGFDDPDLDKGRRARVIDFTEAHVGLHGGPQVEADADAENPQELLATLKGFVDLALNKVPLDVDAEDKKCVYDIQVGYHSTNIPAHADEWDGDGPGRYIFNFYLLSDGVLMFHDGLEWEKSEPVALYVGGNYWTMFSDYLRLMATHEVHRIQVKPEPIDLNKKKPPPNVRLVVTVRIGEVPLEQSVIPPLLLLPLRCTLVASCSPQVTLLLRPIVLNTPSTGAIRGNVGR